MRFIKAFIFVCSTLFSTSILAWGDSKYCNPFDENKCKKDDVIIVDVLQALEYCDFNYEMASFRDRFVVCVYIGRKREERK
jgi:hypothetical protein